MNLLKVFISYSTKDKYIAGKLKQLLTVCCGYEAFVAHDDLSPGLIFTDEIIKSISLCHFFIPLLSTNFKNSDYTDQEIGIAVSLKKEIIPIKTDSINPYGLINNYHAILYKSFYSNHPLYKDNIIEITLAIGKIALSHDKNTSIYLYAKDSLVEAFCNSGDFHHTNIMISLLLRCHNLSPNQIYKIKSAIKVNRCLSEAYGLTELNTFFQNTYKVQLV